MESEPLFPRKAMENIHFCYQLKYKKEEDKHNSHYGENPTSITIIITC